MLKTTHPNGEGGRRAIYDYETKFIKKIELAKGLPHYPKIEKWAQDCIYNHTGFGYSAIRAISYMDLVNEMTEKDFIKWAKNIKTEA